MSGARMTEMAAQVATADTVPLIRRVQVRNYKSLARCVVDLGALTFFVGPNGAGKSNFLDALRFVSDALNSTVEQALRDRGGVQNVRRQSRGHPTHFSVSLELNISANVTGSYAFTIGAQREGAFVVKKEECRVRQVLDEEHFFVVEEGIVRQSSTEIRNEYAADRLALVSLSGLPEFRPIFDALTRMGFYSLNPDRIRDLQDPDPGQILARDGRNLASVVRELGRYESGRILEQVNEHLRAVVPGIASVAHEVIGPKETLLFRQRIAGDENPWRFLAANMSDGTVRALGTLVAVFQAAGHRERAVRTVGIEEPEIALHPGAAEVITEALLLASEKVQVLVTTHSPEILDHKEITDQQLRAVSSNRGNTIIGPLDPASRDALRARLYSPGELLLQGQLQPDEEQVAAAERQMQLFSDGRD